MLNKLIECFIEDPLDTVSDIVGGALVVMLPIMVVFALAALS